MNVKKLSILLLGAFLTSWPTTVMAQEDDIPRREVSVGMGFGTSNLGMTRTLCTCRMMKVRLQPTAV